MVWYVSKCPYVRHTSSSAHLKSRCDWLVRWHHQPSSTQKCHLSNNTWDPFSDTLSSHKEHPMNITQFATTDTNQVQDLGSSFWGQWLLHLLLRPSYLRGQVAVVILSSSATPNGQSNWPELIYPFHRRDSYHLYCNEDEKNPLLLTPRFTSRVWLLELVRRLHV